MFLFKYLKLIQNYSRHQNIISINRLCSNASNSLFKIVGDQNDKLSKSKLANDQKLFTDLKCPNNIIYDSKIKISNENCQKLIDISNRIISDKSFSILQVIFLKNYIL